MRRKGLHDEFFKEVFSHKEEMQEFIIQTFPTEIVNKLDFQTLIYENTTYIDNRLKKYFSDLVYTCSYGKRTIKIALLFEHKSKAVEFPQFQLLEYILKIWAACLKKKEKRIVVVPIVFYHGKEAWNSKELYKYFGAVDENLRRFIPKFDYILINTSSLSDRKLKSYKSATLRIAVFLLKYIFNKKLLQEKFEDFFETNKEYDIIDNENFVLSFYEYLLNNLNEKEMKSVMEKVRKIEPFKGLTLAERFAKRNFEEGIEKGIEEGIEKGKLEIAKKMIREDETTEKIIYYTGLTKIIIEKLRKDVEKELTNVEMNEH